MTRRRDTLAAELDAAGAAGDLDALARIGTDLATIGVSIEAVEERWLELATEAESAGPASGGRS